MKDLEQEKAVKQTSESDFTVWTNPWENLSTEALKILLKMDIPHFMLPVVLDEIEKHRKLFSEEELDKHILKIISEGVKADLSDSQRNNWAAFSDEVLFSLIEKIFTKDIEGFDEEFTYNFLILLDNIKEEMYLTKPDLTKRIIEFLGKYILNSIKDELNIYTPCVYDILRIASTLEEPIYAWNNELFVEMIETFVSYVGPRGKYGKNCRKNIGDHLCCTRSDALRGREKLYEHVVSKLLDDDGVELFLDVFMDMYNISPDEDSTEYLSDIPWIQNKILDGLVHVRPEIMEETLQTVLEIKRLPETKKTEFFKNVFCDYIQNRKSNFYTLLSILCAEWDNLNPELVIAEYIVREGKKYWGKGEVQNIFASCIAKGVFTDGDFFLSEFLSKYKKTDYTLSTTSESAEFFLQPFLSGMDKFLNILLLSLENPEDPEKTTAFHQKLCEGPLKNFIEALSPEESVECKALRHKYLTLLGTMSQAYGEGRSGHVYTDGMVM